MESEPEAVPDGSILNDDTKALLPSCKIYKRRIYIVIVFAYLALLQIVVWNTWGPVSDTARKVYGWDNTTLALLPNWGTILILFLFVPMVNIILRYGLRFATVHCALLTVIGTGIRCIPGSNLYKTVSAHLCAILTGYTGALTLVAPTAVSAAWFPPDERTKSTAFIGISAQNIATAVSFFVPKLMVHDYNITGDGKANGSQHSENFYAMEHDLNNLMYLHFALCLAAFLAIAVYFPKKPPLPPSASSAVQERIDFRSSAVTLMKSVNFWIVFVALGLPVGFQYTFMSVLDETLLPYGISQYTSNWIGLFAALSGIVGGLLFSSLSDYNKKLMKPLLIFCMFGCAVAYSCFALISFGVIPGHTALFYTFLIVGAFFGYAVMPLVSEFGCEIWYPISEEVINGFLSASTCLCGCIFLGLVMIKEVGTAWVPAGIAGAYVLATPLMMTVRADLRRFEVDNSNAETQSPENL